MKRPVVLLVVAVLLAVGLVGITNAQTPPTSYTGDNLRCTNAVSGDGWNSLAVKVGAPSGLALAQQDVGGTLSTTVRVGQRVCFYVPPVATTTSTVAPTTSTTTTVAPTTSTTLPAPVLDYTPSDFFTTGGAIPADMSQTPFGEGAFRTVCLPGQLRYDDPIVYPGQSGASHLHQFFGNLNLDANTTEPRSSGNSTCQGGPINRTGYWVPALIDPSPGVVVRPNLVVVYYKGEPNDPMGSVQTMPPGLRMITDRYSWSCGGSQIGDACNGEIKFVIEFAQCWNGQNDSANHRSHVAFPTRNPDTGKMQCPSTHRNVIPRITYNVYYTGQADTSDWVLSSDSGKPGGSSAHGDWMNGWGSLSATESASNVWWQSCLAGFRNCNDGELGDGRKLTGAVDWLKLPSRVPVPAS